MPFRNELPQVLQYHCERVSYAILPEDVATRDGTGEWPYARAMAVPLRKKNRRLQIAIMS